MKNVYQDSTLVEGGNDDECFWVCNNCENILKEPPPTPLEKRDANLPPDRYGYSITREGFIMPWLCRVCLLKISNLKKDPWLSRNANR